MSLINRNPQRKTAVFSLPGHHGSLCSITAWKQWTWKHFYKYCQKWFCIHFIKLFRHRKTNFGCRHMFETGCRFEPSGFKNLHYKMQWLADQWPGAFIVMLSRKWDSFFLAVWLRCSNKTYFNWLKISKLLKTPCRYLPNLTCTALINNFMLTLDQMTMCKAKNITQSYKPAEHYHKLWSSPLLLICFHGL